MKRPRALRSQLHNRDNDDETIRIPLHRDYTIICRIYYVEATSQATSFHISEVLKLPGNLDTSPVNETSQFSGLPSVFKVSNTSLSPSSISCIASHL
ncbi:hypothetical protein J6590_093932 [Homalodisca vitripennis]|nr:hypothetical protein J6590_093932 [Homalodisca vitripennis]